MGLLIIGAYRIGKKVKMVPDRAQNAAEAVVDGLLDFMTAVAGNRKKAEKFFPVVATIFLFILASNWAGILPGAGSIGFYKTHAIEAVSEYAPVTLEGEMPAGLDKKIENDHGEKKFVPFFRTVNSDLNVTLALALIAVTLSHYFGVATIGAAHHAGKFFNFKNPIQFFVGILEFISEFAKIISFSFRLFGNIFAGEALLTIITFLVPIVAPLPFYGLELFVGLIQALIFAVLTMMFLSVATEHH